ncbi:MAG TPA: hypothetical protein VNL77_04085 [Roseiflexaceae bacterium]|nr:hypothetical protein [Roseiflexaceae bacterium]
MLDKLTSADFAPYLNQAFRLYPGPYTPDGSPAGAPLPLELVSVTDLGDPPPAGAPLRRRPFSLLFRASSTGHLPQRIYVLEHERLGRLDIFLVPIGPDQLGMRYEAIFT